MYPSLFKIITKDFYTLYEWRYKLSRYFSNGFIIDSLDDLRAFCKLASKGISLCKGRATITFNNTFGDVVTLVPIDWSRVISSQLDDLYMFLKSGGFRWCNIPEVFFLNDLQPWTTLGLGQLIVLPDMDIAVPFIQLSLMSMYIRDDSDYPTLEHKVLTNIEDMFIGHPTLKFRLFYSMCSMLSREEWLGIYGIDEKFDLIKDDFSGKVEKFCVRSLGLVLDNMTRKECMFLQDTLESINNANYSYKYPIEYKFEEVNGVWQLIYYLYSDRGL